MPHKFQPMVKFVRNNLISLSVLVSGVIISLAILFAWNLDVLEKIFTIAGTLSLWVALVTYFYQKHQDRTAAAIKQISFFRKEIIPEWDKINKLILKKDPNYLFPQIPLDQPSMQFIKSRFSRNFPVQKKLFFDDTNLRIDPQILDSQIFFLNMFEELALNILHYEISDHPALFSIKSVYIEALEKNAVALAFVREVVVGKPIYSTALTLYSVWRNKERRSTTPLDRMVKSGFITDAQRQSIPNQPNK